MPLTHTFLSAFSCGCAEKNGFTYEVQEYHNPSGQRPKRFLGYGDKCARGCKRLHCLAFGFVCGLRRQLRRAGRQFTDVQWGWWLAPWGSELSRTGAGQLLTTIPCLLVTLFSTVSNRLFLV